MGRLSAAAAVLSARERSTPWMRCLWARSFIAHVRHARSLLRHKSLLPGYWSCCRHRASVPHKLAPSNPLGGGSLWCIAARAAQGLLAQEPAATAVHRQSVFSAAQLRQNAKPHPKESENKKEKNTNHYHITLGFPFTLKHSRTFLWDSLRSRSWRGPHRTREDQSRLSSGGDAGEAIGPNSSYCGLTMQNGPSIVSGVRIRPRRSSHC